MTSAMIAVDGVSKYYGAHAALDDVSFAIEPGAVVGLLGRNGAGKTTTLRILAGVTRPSRGRIRIGDSGEVYASPSLRSQIGYLPESAPLYPELRVSEHLSFRAAQKALARAQRRDSVEKALRSVGAWPIRDRLCGHLSRGMRQRVGLADALLTNPKLLLLDEPTAGLDPTQARETRELIRSLAPRTTVVVSTHILREVEALCGSAIVIDQGRIVARGSLASLHALGRATEIVVTLRCTKEQAASTLAGLATAGLVMEELGKDLVRVTITCPEETTVDEYAEMVSRTILRAEIPLREIKRKAATLEEIFGALTAHEESDAARSGTP